MATWYVHTGGSDLNSGGTDTDAASQSGSAGVVVTTTLTEVAAFAAAAATGSINLQDAGNSLIRTYTKVNDDSITLDSAPTSGDGTYAWKIGGARAAIKKVIQTGTGNNAKIASGDTVYAQTGTYTENAITITPGVTLRGNGGMATIDGTGGGAGSDVLTYNGCVIQDIIVANAVDQGIVRSGGGGGAMQNVRATSCGGKGIEVSTYAAFCSARSCAGDGITANIAGCSIYACEAGDGTADGFKSAVNTWFKAVNCLAYDNGGDGCETSPNALGSIYINCTFEGNTGSGLVVTGQSAPTTGGAVFLNNLFTNNGAYGVNASAAQTAPGILCDYNLYFGNATAARNNWITGTNDSTTDPAFTAAASDDYSIKSTGGAYKAGYSPFKNPTLNTLNIGAVPGPGSTQTVDAVSGGSGLFPGYR